MHIKAIFFISCSFRGGLMRTVLALALGALWSPAALGATVSLSLKGDEPVAQTSETFICATMDWWPKEKCDYNVCGWTEAPYGGNPSIPNQKLTDIRLKTAVQTLSPFVLRLGGSVQDHIFYQTKDDELEKCVPMVQNASAQFGFQGGCLLWSRWKEFDGFCKELGCEIVFGLNNLVGRTHLGGKKWEGAWDQQNAVAFLERSQAEGVALKGVELGNELGGWNGIAAQIEPEVIAGDFVLLSNEVKRIWGDNKRPLVLGPDNTLDEDWFDRFLAIAGPHIDGVTIHLYALGAGVDPNLKNTILTPTHSALAEETAANLTRQVEENDKGDDLQLWMGEAGGAYNSGQNGTTNRFIIGFWSLSELAIFARQGFSTYCRQTLLGGNYGLIDKDTLIPNPDFYNFLLFNKLLGPKVLDVAAPDDTYVKAFAHCSRTVGVTLLLLNYKQDDSVTFDKIEVEANGNKIDLLTSGVRQDFLLTSNGIVNSTTTLLNGVPLGLTPEGRIPEMTPKVVGLAGEKLTLPATSYGFFLFPEAILPACA